MNQHFWTDANKAALVALFKLGWDDKKIAEAVGHDVESVGYKRRALGLRHRTHGGGSRWYTKDEDALIVEGWNKGLSDAEIAATLNNRDAESVKKRRQYFGLVRAITKEGKARIERSKIDLIKSGHAQASPLDPIEAKKAACIMHELDLLRAGYIRSEPERIDEGLEQVRFFPRALSDRSYVGSHF